MATYKKVFINKEEAMQAKRDKGVPIKKLNGEYIFLDYEPYGKFFPSEEMVEFTIQPEDEIVDVNETPNCCKIYRYIPHSDEIYVLCEAPLGHDYITGLTTRLFPKRTFVAGELVLVEWYADEAKTDKIIQTDIVYERDFLGHAVRRTTTRRWVLESGEFHPDVKVTVKLYDAVAKISEIQRRRDNLQNDLKLPILGMIQQTTPMLEGETMQEFAVRIQTKGKNFLEQYKEYFTNFVQDGNTEIAEKIKESQISWMDNVIDPQSGITIREYILQQIALVTPQ